MAQAVGGTLGAKGNTVIIHDASRNQSIQTKDGVSVAKEIFLRDDLENIGATMAKQVAEKVVDAAGDGPQPLYAKVLTPNGFTTMGELKVGDKICGTNGTIQEVVEIYPKGDKEIYNIHFAGDRVVECCSDHLWNVTTNRGINKTMTVKSLIEEGIVDIKSTGDNSYKYYTPKTIVEFNKKDLVIDPYTMGVLLGDGSMSAQVPRDGEIEISIGKGKEHIIEKLKLPEGYFLDVKYVESKNYFRIKIKSRSWVKPFHYLLGKLHLLGSTSHTKFIPLDYLLSDISDRELLLQGLLDTDGYKNSRGLYEFSTVSDMLSDDYTSLVRSLGWNINYRLHDRSNDADSYSNKPIHRITQLKGYKYGNKLVNIEATGVTTPMQCIKVSNPDHLYITDDYIVTHNTTTSIVLTHSLIGECVNLIHNGFEPYDIVRELNYIQEKLRSDISIDKRQIETEDDVYNIANISSNSDSEIANIIFKALQETSEDTVINLDRGARFESYIEHTNGYSFDRGYLNDNFKPDNDVSQEYQYPLIFITADELVGAYDVEQVMTIAQTANKPLVIICKDLLQEAYNYVVMNKLRASFPIMVIKAPRFGNEQQNVLDDLAIYTGAKVFGRNDGYAMSTVDIDDLGECDSIKCGSDYTHIFKGHGNSDDISERVAGLKIMLKDSEERNKHEHFSQHIKERISKLEGGICTIYVGGRSELEVDEKYDRFEDSLLATTSAMDRGYISGGGAWYYHKSREIMNVLDNPIRVALATALQAPITTILKNGYLDVDILNELANKNELKYGIDVLTNKVVDNYEAGIIDSAKIPETIIDVVFSFVKTFITSHATIVHKISYFEKVQ